MRTLFSLRPLLWFDAATCAAMAALLLAGADVLAPLLGLQQALLLEAGIILVPFALFVAWAAARQAPHGPAQFIVVANAVWVVGSLLLLAGPWVSPTLLGTAFIAVQAVAVAGIAWLQRTALRTPAIA